MDRNTWSDPVVQREVRKGFVPLRIDFGQEAPASSARREVWPGSKDSPPFSPADLPDARPPTAPHATGYLRPAEMLAFLASEG